MIWKCFKFTMEVRWSQLAGGSPGAGTGRSNESSLFTNLMNYRTRGSTSYIVREMRSVRERERERYRERERERERGTEVTSPLLR